MTRRPTAPDSALTFRAVAALTILASYVVFRLPALTSPWEAAVTWIGAVVCGAIVLSSIEELGLRRMFRDQPTGSAREAVTETFAMPMRWPDEVELAIAESRHEATHALVNRGVLSEHLFTHDVLCEPTPPRGLALPQLTPGVAGWTSELPGAYVGRHRASPHIDRDRFGSLFGSF